MTGATQNFRATGLRYTPNRIRPLLSLVNFQSFSEA